MKVGVIIPDRGDRPELLNHCLHMMRNQTRKPDIIEVVNFKSKSNDFDLTERVRKGFNKLKKECDCVLIIENDDWYSCDYINIMINAWEDMARPDLLGTSYTYYYHVFKQEYRKIEHPRRASLMNTLINCNAHIEWCEDNDVFLDLHLWKSLAGITITPTIPISMGIKHGIGLCGGSGHNAMRYENKDFDYKFLSDIVDEKSLILYKNL